MPKVQNSYIIKGEDVKFWSAASHAPFPHTLSFRLCEKQADQLQGQAQEKKGAGPGPLTHSYCPKRLSPPESESTKKCPGSRKGLTTQVERELFQMNDFPGREENAKSR